MPSARGVALGALPTLRAAAWALRALRLLRRELPSAGLEARVLPPPAAPRASVRGVELALRSRRATCLERSLVVQRWLLAREDPHDVLVGVAGSADALDAHAWIDRYDAAAHGSGYELLARVAPRA